MGVIISNLIHDAVAVHTCARVYTQAPEVTCAIILYSVRNVEAVLTCKLYTHTLASSRKPFVLGNR